MEKSLLNFWFKTRENFWLIPGVMTLGTSAFSFVVIWIDHSLDQRAAHFPYFFWLLEMDAAGARTLLSTIAGSMAGIAGVTFSITMVVLTLASSQFGPRLLRGFMKNLGNQLALGTFISTFIFSLLVLRAVRETPEFVPYIAINLALAFTVLSLIFLIFFFHHVATQIQPESLIAVVAKDFEEAIERLFPSKKNKRNEPSTEPQGLPENFEEKAEPVSSAISGYVQVVDYGRLVALAEEYDLTVRLHYRSGHYVLKGKTILHALSASDPEIDKELTEKLLQTIILGKKPTLTQDVEFTVSQMVEIAVRALSPGINDPFTAMQCIDALTTGLCMLASRPFPSPFLPDGSGRLRVRVDRITFSGILDTAFNQIRQNTRSSVAVRIRLLEALSRIAVDTYRPGDKAALARHAQMIQDGSQHEGVFEKSDRADVQERYELVNAVLNGGADPSVDL